MRGTRKLYTGLELPLLEREYWMSKTNSELYAIGRGDVQLADTLTHEEARLFHCAPEMLELLEQLSAGVNSEAGQSARSIVNFVKNCPN